MRVSRRIATAPQVEIIMSIAGLLFCLRTARLKVRMDRSKGSPAQNTSLFVPATRTRAPWYGRVTKSQSLRLSEKQVAFVRLDQTVFRLGAAISRCPGDSSKRQWCLGDAGAAVPELSRLEDRVLKVTRLAGILLL